MMGPLVRELTAPGHDAAAAAPPLTAGQQEAARLPRPGWPEKSDLDYLKVVIELGLLLIAVPYVLSRLGTRPATTMRQAGRKHIEP